VCGFDDRTLALVNAPDGRFVDERQHNCGECARAVASLLNGQPEAARPLLPGRGPDGTAVKGERADYMEQAVGAPGELARHEHGRLLETYDANSRYALDPEVAQGFAALERDLLHGGPGAQAVVEVTWKPEPFAPPGSDGGGHWFNAANIDGRIVYIDGQQADRGGTAAEFVDEYKHDAAQMSWIRAECT
jgi:Papain fold toxin 1, glutamine deamidase